MREQNLKARQNIQDLWNNFKGYNIGTIGIPEEVGKNRTKVLEVLMTGSFPKYMADVNHKSKNSENTKQDKYQKKQKTTIPKCMM